MANSKNQLPGLKQLASTKPKAPGAGSQPESTPSAGSFKPGRLRDVSLSALTGKISSSGLRFGGSSSSGTTSAGSGSQWTNLLKQTASGGVSSALGGGLKDMVELHQSCPDLSAFLEEVRARLLPSCILRRRHRRIRPPLSARRPALQSGRKADKRA